MPLLVLVLFMWLYPGLPAWAITDQEIVKGLEALGDYRAAYPMAVTVAEQQGGYQSWRDVAAKYAKFDQSYHAYRRAWEEAHRAHRPATYKDFMTLRPDSPLNALAVHGLYQVAHDIDTIQAYREFMDGYPNAVEAAAALLRIHEIAFDRSRQENRVEVYDAFIETFPLAKQVSEAVRYADEVERKAINAELGWGAGYDKRDQMAHRLFNEARKIERDDHRLSAARHYRVLEEMFVDTRAVTEMLDRAERLEFQKEMLTQQHQVQEAIARMGQALSRDLQASTQRLEAAISEHNRNIEQAMTSMAVTISRNYADRMGDVARAIQDQRQALTEAARDAQGQRERLFQEAQETQKQTAYDNRRCSEILARQGRYGWFDGCS